jgi:hypothetical protein
VDSTRAHWVGRRGLVLAFMLMNLAWVLLARVSQLGANIADIPRSILLEGGMLGLRAVYPVDSSRAGPEKGTRRTSLARPARREAMAMDWWVQVSVTG